MHLESLCRSCCPGKRTFTIRWKAWYSISGTGKNISHEHTHEYCELFLVGSGSGIHVINEKPYLLSSGTLCYLNRQDYHLFEEMKALQQVNLLYLGRDNFNFIKQIDYLLPQEGESNVWQVDVGIMQRIFDRLASHNEAEFSDKLLAESHKEMTFSRSAAHSESVAL